MHPHRTRTSGFTITEALVVLAIIMIVAAVLTPVIADAKRGAKIQSSISNMRQLYLSLQQYRQDFDGIDGVYEYYALALPTGWYFDNAWSISERDLWPTPCGNDPDKQSGPPVTRVPGWITYPAQFYEPLVPATGLNWDLRTYLADHQLDSVLFVDIYCDPPQIDRAALFDPNVKKRALAVLLSGRVVNRIKSGSIHYLTFFR